MSDPNNTQQSGAEKKHESLSVNEREIEQVFEKALGMQQEKDQRDKIIADILSVKKEIDKKHKAMIKKIADANKAIEKEKKAFEVFEKKAFEKVRVLQEALEKLHQ